MTSTATNRPQSLMELFLSFNSLTMQGFGGVLPVVQRDLVERRRWLTQEEFVEDWAVVQIFPGANVVKLAIMLGTRYFGWRGAVTALAGMLVTPMILVLLLAMVYSHFAHYPQVVGVIRGMGAVAAALIIGSGMRLFATLKFNPLGLRVCMALGAACFVMVGVLRWPVIYALAGLGTLACVMAYKKLGR